MESAWAPVGANNKTALAGTNNKTAKTNIEKRAIIISVLPPDFRLLHDHRILSLFFFHALVDELHLLVEIMRDLGVFVLHPALTARHLRRLRRHFILKAVDGGLPLGAGRARQRSVRAGGERKRDRYGTDRVPGERPRAANLSQGCWLRHGTF